MYERQAKESQYINNWCFYKNNRNKQIIKDTIQGNFPGKKTP